MMAKSKAFLALSILSLLPVQCVFSGDQTVINNNGAPAQPTVQCNGNQNNIYDPRVAPEGTYNVSNGDGSSQQIYTTGEKKPYYVDNNCNNNNYSNQQPNVWVQPNVRGPRK